MHRLTIKGAREAGANDSHGYVCRWYPAVAAHWHTHTTALHLPSPPPPPRLYKRIFTTWIQTVRYLITHTVTHPSSNSVWLIVWYRARYIVGTHTHTFSVSYTHWTLDKYYCMLTLLPTRWATLFLFLFTLSRPNIALLGKLCAFHSGFKRCARYNC